MVCVPCFFIPVLIFLWHKFIQPYVLRFWNPWAVKGADGKVEHQTEFPFSCTGSSCKFVAKSKEDVTVVGSVEITDISKEDAAAEHSKSE